MAIEANPAHSAVGHPAATRRTEAAKGAGDSAAVADPQVQTGFLALLASMQADSGGEAGVDDLVNPQADPSALPITGMPSVVAPAFLAAPNAPFVPTTGARPFQSAGEEGARAMGSSAAASLTAVSGMERGQIGAESLPSVTSDLGLQLAEGDLGALKAAMAQFGGPAPALEGGGTGSVSGVASGAAKPPHMRGPVASGATSAPSTGLRQVVEHWSKNLDMSVSAVSTGLVPSSRGESAVVPPVVVGSALPSEALATRPELSTTFLFGGEAGRRAWRDESGKVEVRELSSIDSAADVSPSGELDASLAADNVSRDEVPMEQSTKYWMNADGPHQAELKLGELAGGPVEVSIQLQGSETSVSFRADAGRAQDALLAGGHQLENLLKQEGLVLSGMSVGGFGSSHQSGARQHGNGQGQAQDLLPAGVDASAESVMARAPRRGNGLVDHFV